jgi:hypothetical protein
MGFLVSLMKYIKKYESYGQGALIIVDVQKSFRKFFSEMYLHKLKEHCRNFSHVYQLFDNHVDGKKVNKDYLYDENPEVPIHKDLYWFPNQKELIEKRYNYDVDADFYKKILDENIYKQVKDKEETKQIKKGDIFPTNQGTYIVYIGNNHKYFHCPKKLYDLLNSLRGQSVEIVGGSDSECLEDVVTTAETLGVNIKRNWKFIYSATHCPII